MDRLAFALVLLTCAACTAVQIAARPSASAVADPSPSTPVPTIAVHGTPDPTATPVVTARIGGCTDPRFTSRQLLDRYFSLTTTNDAAAVIDCFSTSYRAKGDIAFSAIRWSAAGPVRNLEIRYLDTVNSCDRFAAIWEFVTPDPFFPNPWTIFYTVGPEAGVMRIFDGGTGLVAPEVTRVSCG